MINNFLNSLLGIFILFLFSFLFPGWFPNAFRFASLHISKLQWDFIHYGAPQCEERRFPRLAYTFRFTCYRPVVGQYVTIRNVDDTDPSNNYGQMFPLTIQEIQVLGKRKFYKIAPYILCSAAKAALFFLLHFSKTRSTYWVTRGLLSPTKQVIVWQID